MVDVDISELEEVIAAEASHGRHRAHQSPAATAPTPSWTQKPTHTDPESMAFST